MASNRTKCPRCNGLGSLREKAKDSKSDKDKERFRNCPKCKGRGYTVVKDRWSPR